MLQTLASTLHTKNQMKYFTVKYYKEIIECHSLDYTDEPSIQTISRTSVHKFLSYPAHGLVETENQFPHITASHVWFGFWQLKEENHTIRSSTYTTC